MPWPHRCHDKMFYGAGLPHLNPSPLAERDFQACAFPLARGWRGGPGVRCERRTRILINTIQNADVAPLAERRVIVRGGEGQDASQGQDTRREEAEQRPARQGSTTSIVPAPGRISASKSTLLARCS